MKKRIFLVATSLVLLVGCNSFDRDTFNTLSVSKAILHTAQLDYESSTLPHNSCVFNLINKGKSAQTLAETAFGDYYQVEQAKGDVTALQATLVSDLTQLGPIIVSIKALSTNPTCTGA